MKRQAIPQGTKKEQQPKIINFRWGSLPLAALSRQTMRELQLIATREGTTIEQVMSRALDYELATHKPLQQEGSAPRR